MSDSTSPRWFDGTVNLPTILSVIGAAAAATTFCVSQYNTLEHRVTVLEQESKYASDNRIDVKQALQDINVKLDKLNERLINNSAGNRPEMQRWSK